MNNAIKFNKQRLHQINKKGFLFNKLFLLLLIIININYIYSQNATTCYEMYTNKTVMQNCFSSSACCYLEYSFYNNTMIKCIEKLNITEDICPGINDITEKEGASLSYCDCFANFYDINLLYVLIILFNIF